MFLDIEFVEAEIKLSAAGLVQKLCDSAHKLRCELMRGLLNSENTQG